MCIRSHFSKHPFSNCFTKKFIKNRKSNESSLYLLCRIIDKGLQHLSRYSFSNIFSHLTIFSNFYRFLNGCTYPVLGSFSTLVEVRVTRKLAIENNLPTTQYQKPKICRERKKMFSYFPNLGKFTQKKPTSFRWVEVQSSRYTSTYLLN